MPTTSADAMATPVGPSALSRAMTYLKEVQNGDSKPARLALKALSIFTGVFLIIAGVFGTTEIFGEFVYFVGSIYAILFGLLVLVIELTDKAPIIKRAYDWIDIYLKFLTLQRGKGLFYCGVGVLVFFIGTGNGGWGLNNAAAMFLFIDGGIHTCGRPLAPPPACTAALPQRHTHRRRHTTLNLGHRLKLVKESGPAQAEGMAAVFPSVTEWEQMRAQASDLDGARGAGR